LKEGDADNFHDLVFESSINRSIQQTDENFAQMRFRDALMTGFYDLQTARDA